MLTSTPYAHGQAEIDEQKEAAEAAFRATPAGKKLAEAEAKKAKLEAEKDKQAAKLRNLTQSTPNVLGGKEATEKLTKKKGKFW